MNVPQLDTTPVQSIFKAYASLGCWHLGVFVTSQETIPPDDIYFLAGESLNLPTHNIILKSLEQVEAHLLILSDKLAMVISML